jgi:small subunit ribosomal protein S2
MSIPTLIKLAESGAHFGHHRSLVYPKARDFVFAVRNNVALINLEQTQAAIEQAQKMISDYRASGKTVLFVGTKRSVRNTVKEAAEAIDAPYITERWFGGFLTNFTTILSNIKKMNDLQEFVGSEEYAKLSKKERLNNDNRLHRYQRFLGGLTALKEIPDLIVLASATDDKIAIDEANQLDVPIIAITDTDMNPDRITCPIPANDDAPKAVDLILRSLVAAPTKKSATDTKKEEIEVVDKEEESKTEKKASAKKTTAKKEEKTEKSEKKVVKKAEPKAKATKKTTKAAK